MQDEALVIGFLEMVLDLKGKIKGIKFIQEEKTIQNQYLGKSIKLDVYVEDEEDNVYNIEIQNGKFRNLPKRSRKYQSEIDCEVLKAGEDYDNLKKQYIIFICTGDPFGEGLYKYTFVNRCNELNSLELGDGTTKIFLNTHGKTGTVSKELKAFLDFVEKSTVQTAQQVNDLYVAQLSAKIEKIKSDEALGGIFMTLEEKMNDKYREGLEEGVKEGIKEGIKEVAKSMKSKGYDFDTIATITKLSVSEIENI